MRVWQATVDLCIDVRDCMYSRQFSNSLYVLTVILIMPSTQLPSFLASRAPNRANIHDITHLATAAHKKLFT